MGPGSRSRLRARQPRLRVCPFRRAVRQARALLRRLVSSITANEPPRAASFELARERASVFRRDRCRRAARRCWRRCWTCAQAPCGRARGAGCDRARTAAAPARRRRCARRPALRSEVRRRARRMAVGTMHDRPALRSRLRRSAGRSCAGARPARRRRPTVVDDDHDGAGALERCVLASGLSTGSASARMTSAAASRRMSVSHHGVLSAVFSWFSRPTRMRVGGNSTRCGRGGTARSSQ